MAETSISLFELNQLIRNTLNEELGNPFWIVAEIMEMHVNRSGHCYLELVEKTPEGDSIRARAKGTIWANQFSMLKPFFETSTGIKLNSGIKILFRATVEFHELYGLSLNITDLDPAYTLGDLARKKQEVIRRLNEEGVFDMNKELPLPLVPQRIAIISSITAAGYGDFTDTLDENNFGYRFRTVLFPSILQGDQAVTSIINAFEAIYARESEFDCVALIRGGGSQSDLECYNQYDLAYHITQFPLPVLTGIGHERDESVCDMVAAKQLKTPTAVAEFLIDRMLSFEMLLNTLSEKIQNSVKLAVRENLLRINQLENSIVNNSRYFVRIHSERISNSGRTLSKEVRSFLMREKEKIISYNRIIELVHPDTILARGYSITRINGQVVKKLKSLSAGQKLETLIKEGTIISTIDETIKK